MNRLRLLGVAGVLSVIAWISVALVVAQNVDIDAGPFFRVGGRQVMRLWQDFTLRENETTGDALVIAGDTTIAGEVRGDLVVLFGPVRLEPTARLRQSVIVVGGDVTIADGAQVWRDLVVIAGATNIPATFYPGGEHIVVGNAWMGRQLRAIVPWVTYGLLWGRLIVLSIGWVWSVIAIFLILTLAVNLLLHTAVGQCADTIASRPAGTFMTGMLMLLLTGPVAVLLAATVIGVAVVPFLICAVIVAWITGKVGVSRWIGRTILGHGAEETRLEAMLAVVAGFVGICLLYAVPIVGIVTWALVGVFGLGSATLTVIAALRRERGPVKPKIRKGQDTTADRPEPPAAGGPGGASPLDAPAMAFTQHEPVYDIPAVPASSAIPPVPPPDTSGGWIPVAAAIPGGGALGLMARATFIDRLAAGVLDVLFVLFVFNVFLDRWVFKDGEAQFLLLFAYFVVFWAWKGTTLGGIVCNLRVARVNGTLLSGSDALVRGLASLFSFVPFGLGFFWILRDPQNQAWHDKITGTIVVKVPRDYPL